ncbi:MAG: TetR/AcrR family transcriptional regulator [Pseudomonadales bacterium]
MEKGQATKRQILEVALLMATQSSLNDLTIGALAVAAGMSKSGLFAHFKSKENLQLEVLRHAHGLFRETVIEPGAQVDDPLLRLQGMCERWLGWYAPCAKTCIYISAAVEFDDQEGAVRDKIQRDLALWLGHLRETVEQVIDAGHFVPQSDAEQFVYELYSLYLGSQSTIWMGIEDDKHSRFKLAFANLVERYRGAS